MVQRVNRGTGLFRFARSLQSRSICTCSYVLLPPCASTGTSAMSQCCELHAPSEDLPHAHPRSAFGSCAPVLEWLQVVVAIPGAAA
ncbi:hypothetical protein R6Q59_030627 [Mikania micrantha]